MCAVVPHHLGKGHPLRVPRCIPSGKRRIARPFPGGQGRSRRSNDWPLHHQSGGAFLLLPTPAMTGETSLSPGPHDGGSLQRSPQPHRPRGCRAPLDTHDQPSAGWMPSGLSCPEPRADHGACKLHLHRASQMSGLFHRHPRRFRHILEWIFPATRAKLIGHREQ